MHRGRAGLAGAVAAAVLGCALGRPTRGTSAAGEAPAPEEAPSPADAAGAPGRVELAFTTTTAKGKYAPKHVLAVWVTDSRGAFVRTLLLNAKSKKKYLQRWVRESGKDAVDAVTGATLKAHGAVVAVWDCRDAKGQVVPDGEYRVEIEFAEDHKEGPTTPPAHLAFAKGPKPATVEPKDLDNIRGLKLVYTPTAAGKSRDSSPAPASRADAPGAPAPARGDAKAPASPPAAVSPGAEAR